MNGLSKPKYLTTACMTRISMLGAICGLLCYLEFPLFTPFLKIDFSFIPVILAGCSMGFVPGLIVLVIGNLIKLFGSLSQGVGQIANFIIGLTMLATVCAIYKHYRTRTGAIIAMLVGTVLMAIVSIPANLYIYLPFYGIKGDYIKIPGKYEASVFDYILYAAIPFNLVKGVAVSIVTYLIYKPLSPFLKKGLKA